MSLRSISVFRNSFPGIFDGREGFALRAGGGKRLDPVGWEVCRRGAERAVAGQGQRPIGANLRAIAGANSPLCHARACHGHPRGSAARTAESTARTSEILLLSLRVAPRRGSP